MTGVHVSPASSKRTVQKFSRSARSSGTELVEGQVAAPLEVLGSVERHLDDDQLAGLEQLGVGGATLEALLVALDERADAVEAGAVGGGVLGGGADAVAQLEEARHGLVEVVEGELEEVGVAGLDVGGPRAGEAVGLELGEDRGALGAGAELDRVPELVGEHDAQREASELLVEAGDQVHVVPRDQVGRRAEEGVLGDVAVVGRRLAAWRLLAVGPVGPEPARDRLVRLAVEILIAPRPERIDVDERGLHHLVAGGRVTAVETRVGGDGLVDVLVEVVVGLEALIAFEGELRVVGALLGAPCGDRHADEQQGKGLEQGAVQRGCSSRTGRCRRDATPVDSAAWPPRTAPLRARSPRGIPPPSRPMWCSPTAPPPPCDPSVPTTARSSPPSTPRQSPQSIYYRYFSPRPRLSESDLERFTHVDYVDRFALVALRGGELIGVARYDRWRHRSEAEVAFFVDDANHGRGLATLLLEHLAVRAREVGLTGFTASVLPENRKMIGVFTQAGFETATRFADGVVEVRLGLLPTPEAEAAIDARARSAAAEAVRRLLSPRSIAVIGAGRDPGTVGHDTLVNLQRAGFAGPVWPVNPNAQHVGSTRAVASILDLTEEVDLAVIAVPAAAVPAVVEECGRKQVYGVVILSAGFAELGEEGAALEAEVLRLARSWGVRIVGPNCLGIINTDPSVRLHATFAHIPALRGRVSLLSESGMVGAVIVAQAREVGLGISSMVALGNRADVSGNDLLQYWEGDASTDVVCMYIESLGNPRHFSRLARRLTRAKPVVAVKAGRLPTTMSSLGVDDTEAALLRQTGVIRVPSLPAMLDTARLLASQPLPAGRHVAVVGNPGGSLAIAVDAVLNAGSGAGRAGRADPRGPRRPGEPRGRIAGCCRPGPARQRGRCRARAERPRRRCGGRCGAGAVCPVPGRHARGGAGGAGGGPEGSAGGAGDRGLPRPTARQLARSGGWSGRTGADLR